MIQIDATPLSQTELVDGRVQNRLCENQNIIPVANELQETTILYSIEIINRPHRVPWYQQISFVHIFLGSLALLIISFILFENKRN